MSLPSAVRSMCLVSVLALGAGGALAQSDDAAAAAEEAVAALLALREPSAEDLAAAEEAAAEARATAVEEATSAFEALAAESAARAEADAAARATEAEAVAAAERAEAVENATSAFEALAAESAARAEAEAAARAAEAEAAAAAERAEALASATSAFEALAAESAARAEEAAAADRAEAVEAASSAFAALAEESAARAAEAAAAQAALDQCIEIAGEPSAENFPSEEAQRAALTALREALPACRTAAEALPDEGAPLYHLATASQAAGRHRRAVPLYERAAEAGVPAAFTRLGDYHNFGLRPVREDAAQAVEFYRQAADAGDPAGMATLAFMYRLGRGVETDTGEMVRLMQMAADAGYPFAQINLAQTFLRGEGVLGGVDEALGIPDARRAVPLLVDLANSGNTEAIQDLIQLYSDGAEGVPPSDFLRGGWVEQLAATGDPAGIAARGFLYEQGIGRGANPELAAADYVAALETGEVEIEDMRGTIDGRTPPWDQATAIAFQTILAERGLYTMRIDGDVGPGTRRAAQGLSE
ncbi:tetratricopeptide repeat protein [Jannaschia sp. CCS1]|uniref:tetratricopeptide repeat protein n=1 Tax=Jannaschia sp. (strain CCS1) TaxID=290400 RepID=UPI000053B2B0|nr:tetratricopeptide repeat protein [Jannaschia sp. CCS1]ABD55745.1 Sel1-like protein [Jannaschia sp. CCS1]